MKHLFIAFPLLLLFLNLTSAQSPAAAPAAPAAPLAAPPLPAAAPPLPVLAPAAAPARSGPTSVTAILAKDGRFTIFIKLLQSTKVANELDTQLADTNQGLTIFAPTDSAFASLKTGTLNSLTEDQKVKLMQFHVLTSYISPSQFQTASNPLRTQAGSSTDLLALNVTLPPPPPPAPSPKKAPKASPAYIAPIDSSSVNCQPKQVLHAMACVMLVLAAFP